MGKTYVRKTTRANFSQDTLAEAMNKVNSHEMGVNEASREYGISSRTLRRHLKSGSSIVKLGRGPELGPEHEKRLVAHIKSLEKIGFAPDAIAVRSMAYKFAEKLNINHRFSQVQERAGDEWFKRFLYRNKELSIRKSEGLSVARANGMNRKEVGDYFTLLQEICTNNDLFDKPGQIYNVDETGIQINNKPGKVVATKGAKDVYSLTSSEKGENVSLVACCNAEGNYIPPVVIFKGKYKKDEFSDGLPPGSMVFMNQKSSYINAELFLKWFRECFLPKKRPGKALLILDGHTSHCNAIELLDLATENDVVLLCLPSHTTQALQPLDRCFFKPLKTYFFQEAKSWMIQNKDRKLSRTTIARLIGVAWGKSATVANAISGFKACGIHPFNPHAIPDHFFAISDASLENTTQPYQDENFPMPSTPPEPTQQQNLMQAMNEPGPSNREKTVASSAADEKETPSKYLREIQPLPLIPHRVSKRKQSAVELTSPENRVKRRVFSEKKEANASKKAEKNKPCTNVSQRRTQTVSNKKKRVVKPRRQLSSSSDSSLENRVLSSTDDEVSDEGEDFCIECGDYYYTTKSKVDWIQCDKCSGWLHETCTSNKNICNKCTKEDRPD
ncbi:tigger transposable element-derived protein 2-like [Photinus pyralis]|uniref:tigger transposable element-derived protein 2-like n=1 Tax=Photinus pyralis TaxID=7054 RepID=UPI0012670906|nr:tigger transposable element-derived protein 2-like [Photinus pyralis]XP_031331969.1 tigger transposable element-derived protein 2-like [Photinus pyralis]